MAILSHMGEAERDNLRWGQRSKPAKGPARLCRFCLLSVLLPITLLCIPLYMRFVSLRPHIFTLSPTDMKLLNYEHRVSTTWCRAQTLRMNSTFKAYLLPEKPKLRTQKNRVKMERKIRQLEDDMKEYWGFYLLKDSVYKVSACSRHEGASMVIIKHSKNVERCAWLGELDSAEESDEISNEFDFRSEVLDVDFVEDKQGGSSVQMDASSEEFLMMAAHSKELPDTLANIKQWSQGSRKTLVKQLLEQMLTDKSQQNNADHLKELKKQLGLVDTAGKEEPEVAEVTARGIPEEPFTDASEEETEGGEVDHLFNKGTFNQKNKARNKNDTSNEETRSSWSSSEEALAACEGAMANVALDGATRCHENATFAQMLPLMTNISHKVDSTGFYYFIFTNENEITDNFVGVSFDLMKTVFDVSESSQECNSTECSIPLAFMSEQHVVLEVPQQDSETCEYEAETETSYYQCNTVVTAESICEPRGSVYMTFLLLVPVLVLAFAYI